MYENLAKRLRNCTSDTEDCAGCPYQGGFNGTYCMNGLVSEAADAIEELLPFKKQVEKGMRLLDKADELLNAIKPRWIPVTERLPEERMAVFVYAPKYRNIFMGYLTDDGWKTWAARNGGFDWPTVHEITHWMPLPEPPKEADNG